MLLRALFACWLSLIVAPVQAADLTVTFDSASGEFLRNPHDLKLTPDGRYLLVSDVGNNRVAFLDPDSLSLLGSFGDDHQSGTHDVEFDADGRLYVADTHNNRVTIYRMDGMKSELIGSLERGIRGPEGVLSHPNGFIYVAGAWSGNVVKYARDGEKLLELGGLSSPHDLELNSDGNIWLADSGNSRVLLLSPELEILQELSRSTYDFDGVRYMDMLDEGTLVAADKNNHQVKFIAADGRMLLVLGDGTPGKGANRFVTPEGVEVRGDTLWLSDSGNNRVVKYRINR